MEKIFVRLSFVFCVAITFFIINCPSERWLDSENRCVSGFSFTDSAFTDRIPFRTELVRMNRDVFFALGKNEFAGAFLGDGGYVFSSESVSLDTLSSNLQFVNELSNDIEVHLCIIPSKTDALFVHLPKFYDSGREWLWQTAAKNAFNIPDVLPTLLLAANNGKYVYYRGDHHLTSLGSYYVYKSLAGTLGYNAYGARDFSVSVVKSDFSGSDARKLLIAGDDKISLFRYKGDNGFLVENLDSGTRYNGFYDFEMLCSHDAYGIFPIPNCGHAKVTNGESREKLLLVCDSYGDSLVPFLARHFDIDMIDLRYFHGSVKDLIVENDYASALLCFGMDTVAGKEILYKLKF